VLFDSSGVEVDPLSSKAHWRPLRAIINVPEAFAPLRSAIGLQVNALKSGGEPVVFDSSTFGAEVLRELEQHPHWEATVIQLLAVNRIEPQFRGLIGTAIWYYLATIDEDEWTFQKIRRTLHGKLPMMRYSQRT